MSFTAASNTNEPPSLFSSLPNDLVLNALARVPRRYHPTLSCVSKSFRSLVNSSEFRKTRSLLGKDDAFYVCFRDGSSQTNHWFTLSQNTVTGQNRLTSVPFPSPPELYSCAIMVGPDIYFLYSKKSWILDSRSGKLRQGPSMRDPRRYPAAVGQVDENIYIFQRSLGEFKDIQAEVFDTKRKTWEVARNPDVQVPFVHMSVLSPSLDRKIYAKSNEQVTVYDPRDGKCERIGISNHRMCSRDVCVIDNVLYIYCYNVGLKWYDSKKKEWRAVKGMEPNLFTYRKSAMAEYNGKLAFLRECRTMEKLEIWCAMIALEWSWTGLDIVGKVEWSQRILSVPLSYQITHCFGRTD